MRLINIDAFLRRERLFQLGKGLFQSGRGLFQSGRELFQSGRELFHLGRGLFHSGRGVFHSGRGLFHSGTGLFHSRRKLLHSRKGVEHRTKVLEFRDDEATNYAILSHRWIDPTEVDYEEMVDLAKMDRQEQDEIRGRLGYKKIADTCRQAKKDGYKWVWVDTCCIDKRSSAELSEAINSMYRWYANAKICYAYLHDVDGSSFSNKDDAKYRMSNGWPEWFSRGWTLQEMIAPQNLQFLNKNWQPIGDKKGLAHDLQFITKVPQHILTDGLEGNRPCVAQIISWAAKRTTTRVEDRAYSLMGLLDVNMPMLYGEGKKAFQRLQLQIIRSSNDRSIFAWGFESSSVRIGSILADDPSDFKDCSSMKLMDHDELIKELPELSSTNADHFDVFPITNRGIQIWMPLRRYRNSNSVFRAYLPCRSYRSLVTISLILWNSNYYRYRSTRAAALEASPAEFHRVYLRYQDTSNHTVTFDIDDSGVIENGFTSHVDPKNPTRKTFTLTDTNPFCVKTYFTERGDGHFNIYFGQCLGLDWVHLDIVRSPGSRIDDILKVQMPGGALSMADLFQAYSPGRLWVYHLQLPGSTWIVRIYRFACESERSKIRLRLDVSRGTHPKNCLDKWNAYDVEVSDFFSFTWIITITIRRKSVIGIRT